MKKSGADQIRGMPATTRPISFVSPFSTEKHKHLYGTEILPVLHGLKIWSLALRGEHRMGEGCSREQDAEEDGCAGLRGRETRRNRLTLWLWKWTIKQHIIIYVKREYFTNQKSYGYEIHDILQRNKLRLFSKSQKNIMKYK